MTPQISIIVPAYNEQDTIQLLLAAIYAQTCPRNVLEVVIADMSTDHTRQRVAEFQSQHPDLLIRVVENTGRNIPSGLNAAIKAAQGEWIVRLDAHSAPQPDYVERCLAALQAGLGDNVGGVWDIRPRHAGWQARAIAAAAAHPLGVGDARYRFTGRAQYVDTVPFGAFRRDMALQVGLFDEKLLTNEDYEFNVRIRQAGGKIWLDPSIRSTYFARPNLPALARQYWRYGYWKARMLRNYPHTLRWRQALPPLFVLSLILLAGLSFFTPVAAWIFVLELSVYAAVLLAVGIQQSIQRRDLMMFFGVPLAIMTMHAFWGSAFLWSMVIR